MWRVLYNLRSAYAASVSMCLCVVNASPANADDLLTPGLNFGSSEVWAGADATRDVWVIYSGATQAPWAEHIHGDGVRLRAAGGYGQYSYEGAVVTPQPCGAPRFDRCIFSAQKFNVDVSFFDALVGYQKRLGELTAKGFIGVSGITHRFDVPDANNVVSGDELGPKAVVELWLNLGSAAWSSLDMSYTTAHETGSARWRGGWRAAPEFSIGPELIYDRNAEDAAGRAGAFARIEWAGGELSAAGGWAGVMTGDDDQAPAPYATVNWLSRF